MSDRWLCRVDVDDDSAATVTNGDAFLKGDVRLAGGVSGGDATKHASCHAAQCRGKRDRGSERAGRVLEHDATVGDLGDGEAAIDRSFEPHEAVGQLMRMESTDNAGGQPVLILHLTTHIDTNLGDRVLSCVRSALGPNGVSELYDERAKKRFFPEPTGRERFV